MARLRRLVAEALPFFPVLLLMGLASLSIGRACFTFSLSLLVISFTPTRLVCLLDLWSPGGVVVMTANQTRTIDSSLNGEPNFTSFHHSQNTQAMEFESSSRVSITSPGFHGMMYLDTHLFASSMVQVFALRSIKLFQN